MRSTNRGGILLALATALGACGRGPGPTPSSPVQHLIERAADEENVPRPLLLALAWAESRGSMNPGQQSIDGAWGLFHLIDGPDAPEARSLLRAARLVGLPPDRLRHEAFANALGGAALLREQGDVTFGQYRNLHEERLGDWYEAVMLDSALADARLANGFAAQVYRVLRDGLGSASGSLLHLEPQSFDLDGRAPWVDQSQDLTGDYCPGGTCVRYVQAANYTGGRGLAVQQVVIHDMEGYYESSIEFFTHPSTQASAHYDVRSSDGAITQQVRDGDTAWHAGNWNTNQRSIGIEHEGFAASGNQWYSEAMYKSSAALTRWLSDAYHIPKDRQHIIGHYEVPNPDHPGWFGGSGAHHDPCDTWAGSPTWHNVSRCFWDWNHYMELVGGGGGGGGPPPPPATQGTLSGFVGDACCGTGSGRKPLAGATVSLAGTNTRATTGSDGVYSFMLAPGSYTPHAAAGGFAGGDHTSVGGTATVSVKSGQTTWGSILLHPAGVALPVLRITSPAAGATVSSSTLAVRGTCSGADSVHLNGKSFVCSAGSFSASAAVALGVNTVTVTASNAAGNASASVRVTYGKPATGLAGRITSQRSGAAVSGALIAVSSGAHAQSDGAGNYEIAAPAGTVTMTVSAGGFAATSLPVAVGASGLTPRDVSLTPTPNLAVPSLTIDDPAEGDSFAVSPITLSGTVNDASVTQVSVNGAPVAVNAGVFFAQVVLHEGANTLTASAANTAGQGSASVHVTFAALRTGLQGVVLDGSTGAPIAGAAVAFGSAATKTDAAGRFALEAPPGDRELKVTAAGYQDHAETVGVPAEGMVDLEISLDAGGGDRAGAPQVFIYDPADGDTVSAEAITVHGAVDDPAVTSVLIAGVPTPVVSGEFEGSAALKPGVNTVEVRAENAHGATTARVAVTYTAAMSGVKGTVTAAGAPVPFAVVALQGAHTFAQTGADGSYRLDAAPGSYTLAVSAAGFGPVSRTVDLADGDLATEDVQLTAAPAGAPRVFIADPADGATVHEARLILRGTVDDARIGAVQVRGASFPALHGIFEAEVKLSPGTNLVEVSASGEGGTGTATVAIVLDLPQTGLAGHVASAGDGVAIAGAVLLLEKGGHGETDFGGSYHIDAAPGGYTLTASAAGYEPFARPVTIGADGLLGVDVLLVPAAAAGSHGSVHITSPETGSTAHEGTITVRGQSDVAGLATLVVNGKAVEPDATGAFAARVTLSPGDNQIYARAVDTDGHTYADAVYLTWPVPEATLAAGSTAGCAAAGADPLALLFAAGAALALHGRRRRHPR